MTLTDKDADRVKGMLGLVEAARGLIHAQMMGDSVEIDRLRKKLNSDYDKFLKRNGRLNSRPNKSLIELSPDAPVLLALEAPMGKDWKKADIFTKNTIRPTLDYAKPSTPGEALAISLFDRGRLDIDHIGNLLGISSQEAGRQLGEAGLAFNDPRDGWTTSEIYLSGNVRRKLVEAREAAAADPQYRPNVEALERVQPVYIDYGDIDVRLGSPWLPAEDVIDFLSHISKGKADWFKVNYISQQATWLVGYTRAGERGIDRVISSETWGTPDAGLIDIVEAALNSRAIQIYRTEGSRQDKKRVFDAEASEAANLKKSEMQDAFKDWVWEADSRRERLHRYYNDNFNNIRTIHYDAAHYKNKEGDYQFPGMTPVIKLRPHQANAVWRAVSMGRALFGHEVGTGKTFTMVTTAMELKRLRLANKPAIAVPKKVLPGFARQAKELYPTTNILVIDRFDAEDRKRTAARIATGNYDLVLMTHDHLNMLPMTPQVVESFINQELDELEAAIRAAKEEDDSRNNRVVKQLENAKAKLQTRLKDAIEDSKKDDAVFFEQTGIDFLMIDEAHRYKSLPVYTHNPMKGIPTTRSH